MRRASQLINKMLLSIKANWLKSSYLIFITTSNQAFHNCSCETVVKYVFNKLSSLFWLFDTLNYTEITIQSNFFFTIYSKTRVFAIWKKNHYYLYVNFIRKKPLFHSNHSIHKLWLNLIWFRSDWCSILTVTSKNNRLSWMFATQVLWILYRWYFLITPIIDWLHKKRRNSNKCGLSQFCKCNEILFLTHGCV